MKILEALEQFSRSYYKLLRERKKAADENYELKNQNRELNEVIQIYQNISN